MEPINHAMEPRRWAEVHFGEAPLTDVLGNHREGVQGVRLQSVLAARWPEGATSGEDGLPGWQSLWQGMKKLDLLVTGVRLARNLSGFG